MSTTQTRPDTTTSEATRTKQPWLWNVVLLNDEEHTFEYVVEMCQRIFSYPPSRGWRIAKRVDAEGRGVLMTAHKELAELKCEQICSDWADHRLSASVGPLRAIIEPAECGGDDAGAGPPDGSHNGPHDGKPDGPGGEPDRPTADA